MPPWSSGSSGSLSAWLSSLLRSCAPLSALLPGKQAHAQAIAHGLLPHATLETDLLLMYSRCSQLYLARQVFDRMPHRNMHSWNILLSSYVQTSLFHHALALIHPFLQSGLRPDHFTLPSLLKASAGTGTGDASLGMALHNWAIVLGLEDHVVVRGSILDVYAKCGNLVGAHYLFETMLNRDVVIWNSMISGLARAGHSVEALHLFRRLQWEGEEMDSRAIPSILHACGGIGDLIRGKEVHGRVIRCLAFNSDTAIGNSLMDMYAKCGFLEGSHKVFLSMHDRDLVTWSTLISCYGVHGKGKEALSLYKEMIACGLEPNCITFTSVLASCSHSGLIDEGRQVFDSIVNVFEVEPRVEHYACMVDLLGRSGSITEALALIRKMPMEPAPSVWGALLGACAVHRNLEVGEIAAYKLFELEAGNPSNYVALNGIYDAVGRWDGVAQMRSRMREFGMVKTPGCSWVDVKGRLHAFYQGGVPHPSANRIHELLDTLTKVMTNSDDGHG
ncbi:pentatricopeptide repeat-containing protein At3g12770 [Phoenix dactylifera]|uniref:Pentatricopeptide repeat-containing protein At3g12770 n=1 Tax=Phoenix dactylifera TaxID=42345 RepID=A0A8B7BW21_PHODC|nr:pentatricopeptide repeat-containing protein At3g12770 [Phoenix dactylifera]